MGCKLILCVCVAYLTISTSEKLAGIVPRFCLSFFLSFHFSVSSRASFKVHLIYKVTMLQQDKASGSKRMVFSCLTSFSLHTHWCFFLFLAVTILQTSHLCHHVLLFFHPFPSHINSSIYAFQSSLLLFSC